MISKSRFRFAELMASWSSPGVGLAPLSVTVACELAEEFAVASMRELIWFSPALSAYRTFIGHLERGFSAFREESAGDTPFFVGTTRWPALQTRQFLPLGARVSPQGGRVFRPLLRPKKGGPSRESRNWRTPPATCRKKRPTQKNFGSASGWGCDIVFWR